MLTIETLKNMRGKTLYPHAIQMFDGDYMSIISLNPQFYYGFYATIEQIHAANNKSILCSFGPFFTRKEAEDNFKDFIDRLKECPDEVLDMLVDYYNAISEKFAQV